MRYLLLFILLSSCVTESRLRQTEDKIFLELCFWRFQDCKYHRGKNNEQCIEETKYCSLYFSPLRD